MRLQKFTGTNGKKTTSLFIPLLVKEREIKDLLLCKEKGWDEVEIMQ
jgi:hypothetical protein